MHKKAFYNAGLILSSRLSTPHAYPKRMMTGHTPPKYPKGTPRKHHFVPRGYLAGFCRDGTERLAVFDREREAYRDRQRPADVAHIKDYYAFEAIDGELNFEVERALGKIEDEALPVIGKIDAKQRITGDEKYALALYVAFQHTRTPAFQSTVDSFSNILTQRLIQMVPQSADAVEAKAEIAEELGVEMPRVSTLGMMLNISPEIAETLYGMNWIFARRPDDKTSFVTTDSPFCLIPGPDHVRQPFRGIGIKTQGILKTLPLSQRTFLLIEEPGDYMYDVTLTREQVRDTNLAVTAQCKNFVFGRDMSLVESVVKAARVDKTKWESRVTSN